MKKLAIIILVFSSYNLFAQKTYVPDDNFEQALIDLGYDSGPLDDSVLTANISGVKSLDVRNKDIDSLIGIDDFTALDTLICAKNNIRRLDVSSNTALTYLNCYDNQLTDIDLSANTALTTLNCYSNKLTTLNLSSNIALTYLNCRQNNIKSLNVSSNTNLTSLNFSFNDLSGIDISSNTALTYLNCGDNPLASINLLSNTALIQFISFSNNFTSLDLSSNTALTYLYCSSNELTSLDLSSNTVLKELDCSSNELTGLDLSSNTALIFLDCSSNQLTSLEVSNNDDLFVLDCSLNSLTNLDVRNGNNAEFAGFNAEDNPDLICIYVDDIYASYLTSWTKDITSTFINDETGCSLLGQQTYVPDDNFEQALIDLGYDQAPLDNYVPTIKVHYITRLSVKQKGIESLAGIEDFNSLAHLYCEDNGLTSLDVSSNAALTTLSCSYNALSSLDVSSNTALIALSCSNNGLTNLDLSSNTALTYLYCKKNNLTSLNVSLNTALTYLSCYANVLTELDIRNGNNANISTFKADTNSNLTCIYVDNKDARYLTRWHKDSTASYVSNETECNPSSLNVLENTNFIIYPNPVKEQFRIQTNEHIETIKLYNSSGKLVKTYNRQTSYSVSDLQSGLYFISITGKGNSYTQKLLIE